MFNQLLNKLGRYEDGLLAFTLLGMAFLTFVETVMRYAFAHSFVWFQEFANYMIVFVTFLGASVGVKYGTHFTMEALTEYASDRVCHLLKTTAYLISALVVALVAWYAVLHILKLKTFGMTSAALGLPLFIPYIPIPLFGLVMSLRFLSLSLGHARAFIKAEPFIRAGRNV